MKLSVQGSKDACEVSDIVFNDPFRENLIHQVVTAYRNAGRAGTKAQQTRSEVSFTSKKMKPQKGGGARHGSRRAPIFIGGGVTFAAKPRDFSQKVNKKMYKVALRSIFSELIRQERLVVVDEIKIGQPKTKAFKAFLEKSGVKNALVMTESIDENLFLSSRNIPHVAIVDAQSVDPLSLVASKHVLVTVDSLRKLEERLS